jgi:hypothetical protein
LTLSHNYLSGEIPLWLHGKKMICLDLSHNKLTGDLDGFYPQDLNFSSRNSSSWNFSVVSIGPFGYSVPSLRLSVNRLSGDLSSPFQRYADLDILSGNLFGCHHLPGNDKSSQSVSCGSQQFDQSMVTMGGVFGLLCVVVLSSMCSLFKSKHSNVDPIHFLHYARYSLQFHVSQTENELPSTPYLSKSFVSFSSLLSRLMWSACVLTALCLLLTLPVYVLKQLDVESASGEGETQYVTHTHMYNWLWTMAFVSGTTPAIILLVAGFVCVSYFTVMMNRLGGGEKSSSSPSRTGSSLSDHHCRSLKFTVWAVFLFNIVVVGTVNGLYIWSTLLDLESNIRAWIQLSFALFSFLWNVAHRIGLPYRIKESRYGVWLFLCLNVMNSLTIPCVVTALSTPSCYQVNIMIPPLSSTYFVS